MMKKLINTIFFICIFAVTVLSSCKNSKNNDEPNVKNEPPAQYSITLSAPQQKVLNQSNDFAFDVLKAINSEDGNVFVSPYSLGQALGMLANGAEGKTYDEIAAVLKIGDGTSLDDINSYYATMNSALTSIKCSSQFAVANSLWVNKDYSVFDDYKEGMKIHYGAKVENVDFSDSKTFDLINSWGNTQTGGHIPSIVNVKEELVPVAMLLNCLFFKGLWSYFLKENTRDDYFRNHTYHNESMKLMHSESATLNGWASDEELAVELDYGGKAFQLMVMMPTRMNINDYIKAFDGAKYQDLLSKMKKASSVVEMPKFKCSFDNKLNTTLKKLGIVGVFDEFAQLDKIAKVSYTEKVRVSNVLQKASIEVNEEGSVATVVTRSDVDVNTAPGISGIYVIKRPFIYLIKERTTGAILFVGKVQSMAGMQ